MSGAELISATMSDAELNFQKSCQAQNYFSETMSDAKLIFHKLCQTRSKNFSNHVGRRTNISNHVRRRAKISEIMSGAELISEPYVRRRITWGCNWAPSQLPIPT